jgi:ribosomal protection tetracycline resistance protein
VPCARLREELAAQARRALVYPVFFGSAVTGAGVPELMAGLAELLPAGTGDASGPASGRIFKVERGPGGEKLAYVRMFSGTVRTRDRLRFSGGHEGKVTAIGVFERGTTAIRASVSAGQIAKLRGLDEIQIGDQIGEPGPRVVKPQFAPPTLESVVAARRPAERAALRVALGQLAEQDPLINVRQSPGELAVSLYGEVQKEVIQATLAGDFGIEVTFRETTTICIERPVGSGRAAELIGAPGNPFPASLGLRVDPAPPGSGVAFRLDVDIRSVPMYVYKTAGNFAAMMTRYVTQALREGLRGWQVTDCTVTMTESGYISPSTTAAHFRKLTPLVLMAALDQAGTAVCEPMIRVSLEIPAETTGSVLAAVARLGGTAGTPVLRAELDPLNPLTAVRTLLPAARAQDLQRQLPGLTSGEGVAETSFGGYRPVTGPPPARRRTVADPRNREEYMLQLAGRATAAAPGQAESSGGR